MRGGRESLIKAFAVPLRTKKAMGRTDQEQCSRVLPSKAKSQPLTPQLEEGTTKKVESKYDRRLLSPSNGQQF